MLLSLLYFALRQLLRLLMWVAIVMTLLALLNSWFYTIRPECPQEVAAFHSSVRTGFCWRRRAGCCYATCCGLSRSRHRQRCAGTASPWGAHGTTEASDDRVDQELGIAREAAALVFRLARVASDSQAVRRVAT